MLIAVGRLGRSPEAALCRDYVQRLATAPAIHEIDDRRRGSIDPKTWQAAQILKKLPANAFVCALDEQGASAASADIAAMIAAARADGRTLAFVIGGADGLDETVRRRADKILAFGRATWPHKLVRVMLLEQLYRADAILTGHPYHRA
ncbi:MAG: 23S rRNA (pseudouridine(1915)-N(3))-methyltransferase RlmH [Alphaproteobacteria bacterium]|nr:MAG: 23S rRNA (pseudouridine(1915)-N(3))-methyltransferase RlmH [Alphaproteobacteria bacterium]